MFPPFPPYLSAERLLHETGGVTGAVVQWRVHWGTTSCGTKENLIKDMMSWSEYDEEENTGCRSYSLISSPTTGHFHIYKAVISQLVLPSILEIKAVAVLR